jgi:hypothetical protein
MSDLIDRSQEIGSKFLAWTPETGPCPISINDHYWFKKLCALFEKQAELEFELVKKENNIERLLRLLLEGKEIIDLMAKIVTINCKERDIHNGQKPI